MSQQLAKLFTALTSRRWLALLVGVAVSAFSTLSLLFVFLFALKDFSSRVRDVYETPPGPIQYVVFWATCVGLLLLCCFGLLVLVKGFWRRGRKGPGSFD